MDADQAKAALKALSDKKGRARCGGRALRGERSGSAGEEAFVQRVGGEGGRRACALWPYGFELEGTATQWQLCWLLAFTSLNERRLARMMRAYDVANPEAPARPQVLSLSDSESEAGGGGDSDTDIDEGETGDAQKRIRELEMQLEAARAKNELPPAGPRAAGGILVGARVLEPERWVSLSPEGRAAVYIELQRRYGGASGSQSHEHDNLLDILMCVLEHAGAVETPEEADAALVRIAMTAIRRQEVLLRGRSDWRQAFSDAATLADGGSTRLPEVGMGGGQGKGREGGEGYVLRQRWRSQFEEIKEVGGCAPRLKPHPVLFQGNGPRGVGYVAPTPREVQPRGRGRPLKMEPALAGGEMRLIHRDARGLLSAALAPSTWARLASVHRRFRVFLSFANEELDGVVDVATGIILFVVRCMRRGDITIPSALTYVNTLVSAERRWGVNLEGSQVIRDARRALLRLGANIPERQAVPATFAEVRQALGSCP
ncbi:hypothetical protein DIPPA_31078 [Diplonema papillatum]|nr:hypothetical protein DIPPA_31078 [Diplonema papillatum]